MPHTKLAPTPASTGAARVAKVPKPAKLPGVFGKAMRGLSKIAISGKLLKRVGKLGPDAERRLVSVLSGQGKLDHIPGPREHTAGGYLATLASNPELLRAARQAPADVPYLQRGSAAWRRAMKDVKEGKTVTLESGGPMSLLKEVSQQGPASRLTPNRVMHHEQYAQRGGKTNRGLYMASADTPQTKMYATGYHDPSGILEPAEDAYMQMRRGGRLQAEFPQSLVQNKKEEVRMPAGMYKQWARGEKIQPAHGRGMGVSFGAPEVRGMDRLHQVEQVGKREKRLQNIENKFWSREDVSDGAIDKFLDRVGAVREKMQARTKISGVGKAI